MKFGLVLIALLGLPGVGAAQSTSGSHAPMPAQNQRDDGRNDDEPRPGWNWADDSDPKSQSPKYAATKAICDRLRGHEPPETDWPDEDTATTLIDCDSEALYYGVRMAAAPVRARQCALLETERPFGNSHPFNGTGMLMTIYANGVGAERNLDLATSLACRIEGSKFDVDDRVKHLQGLADTGWSGHDFSYCQDISGLEVERLCLPRDREIADFNRAEKLDKLSRSWTDAERAQFVPLLAAMEAFASSSSENEVDLTGTARNSFTWDRDQAVRDQFVQLLDALQSARLPASSEAGYQNADAQLNRVYRQIMAIEAEDSGHIDSGTVTQSDIRKAQRSWLRYRDAWIAFSAITYPKIQASSVKTELTRKRVKFLEELAPSP